MVGRRRTLPLVCARQLGGHLALLHAFDALRHDVESGDLSRLPQDARIMDAGTRWGWFLNLAVERFERWCKSIRDVQSDAIERTLPPIDVVMVWHAYLLNPIWYAEDTIRMPALSALPRYTEHLTNHLESPEVLLTNSPNVDRMQFWCDGTMTPYDPFDSAGVLTHIVLRCPHCKSRTNVPILTSDGKGYAQSRFSAHCSSCRGSITRESLGMYKLANNIAKEESEGPGAFLAGTLHTRDEMQDTRRASLIKNRIRSGIKAYSALSSKSKRSVATSDILAEFHHDPSKLHKKLKVIVLPSIITRILYAYSDQRPFSIDLVGAVLRQGSFVHKMVELGWTRPGFPLDDNGALILEHCVARYHAFLNLMVDSPASFFVPTLDIDLAWHTHQLMASRYQNDCKAIVNRYVDHDDKVEEGILATAFDVTCRVWIDRYKVPYTHCGCPQPGPTLGQRVRRALGGKEVADTMLQPPDLATPDNPCARANADSRNLRVDDNEKQLTATSTTRNGPRVITQNHSCIPSHYITCQLVVVL
ncbi:hypothetical protein JVU11DRAFT_2202 [Chiua virens]|nr:hypothetical protein JVU11DRAFT_2202 [Chiua virens]